MQTLTVELPAAFVWSDPERLGGKPCFRNTRLPLEALFANLPDLTVDEFIEAFGGVTREQIVGVLEAVRAAAHDAGAVPVPA